MKREAPGHARVLGGGHDWVVWILCFVIAFGELDNHAGSQINSYRHIDMITSVWSFSARQTTKILHGQDTFW